jgi:hypothetical protein
LTGSLAIAHPTRHRPRGQVAAMTHMITTRSRASGFRSPVDGDPAVREWMLEEIRRRYPELG